eukprot:TRINITY_DN9566_c0_g1_i3.p1 TRINITY_DN9566_c0_g1~~TRINITY_DN9566_c0_g1_i3.p1  ORF type:complete len:202 (+),score=-10.41 TRINITY_DN9566_c0_g1_i3:45-608(+)
MYTKSTADFFVSPILFINPLLFQKFSILIVSAHDSLQKIKIIIAKFLKMTLIIQFPGGTIREKPVYVDIETRVKISPNICELLKRFRQLWIQQSILLISSSGLVSGASLAPQLRQKKKTQKYIITKQYSKTIFGLKNPTKLMAGGNQPFIHQNICLGFHFNEKVIYFLIFLCQHFSFLLYTGANKIV